MNAAFASGSVANSRDKAITLDNGPLVVGSFDIDSGLFSTLATTIDAETTEARRAFVLLRQRDWPVGVDVVPYFAETVDVRGVTVPIEAPESAYYAALPRPKMTVVICTRNRSHLITNSINMFLRLTGDDHELIVVDNAPSDDSTATIVASFGDRVRYILEPTPGLARARNSGLRAATGRFVVFTDDDVTPDPAWLQVLGATFAAHPGAICVSGSVLPASLSTPAELRFQEFGGYVHDFAETEYHLSLDPPPSALFPFHPRLLGTGANMAFRVEALRALGGFDEALGAGTPSRGGEDIDIAVRILLAGHLLVRQPAAVLWHPSHRTDEALLQQIEDYGCGLAAVFTKFMHQRSMAPALLRRSPKALSTMFSSTSSKNDKRSSTYPKHLKRAEWRGLAKGPMAYRRSLRENRLLSSGGRT